MPEHHFSVEGNRLVANGSLDFSRLISQQKAILEMIDQLLSSCFPSVIIDLSSIDTIPSTALGICMAAARSALERNKQMTLIIKKKHSGAIGLIGLHQLVNIELV